MPIQSPVCEGDIELGQQLPPLQYSVAHICSAFLSILAVTLFYITIIIVAIYHPQMYVHLFRYPSTLLPLKLLIWNRSNNAVMVLVLGLAAMICALTIFWRIHNSLMDIITRRG